MPGFTHACPNSAACWSPAAPASGAAWPCSACGRAWPKIPALGSTRGNARSGTPNSSSSSGSQRPAWMSYSIVREALEQSVTCSPVSLKASHESTVPNTARPASTRSRRPSTCSSSHWILVALKYGSSTSPVRSRTSCSWPAARSSSQRAAVRRSCHTIARCRGSPLAGSHTHTVSRWLVTPTASSSPSATPASASASPATDCVRRQSSSASCSTQPGLGKCWVSSR